jgi:hypothetical protein
MGMDFVHELIRLCSETNVTPMCITETPALPPPANPPYPLRNTKPGGTHTWT